MATAATAAGCGKLVWAEAAATFLFSLNLNAFESGRTSPASIFFWGGEGKDQGQLPIYPQRMTKDS